MYESKHSDTQEESSLFANILTNLHHEGKGPEQTNNSEEMQEQVNNDSFSYVLGNGISNHKRINNCSQY